MVICRFINTPVPSNTFLVRDENSKECIIVDPGTKGSNDVIDYINIEGLIPKYILLTHSDFDHIWGVNALKEAFSEIRIVASKETARLTAIPQSYFSSLYFGVPEPYSIEKIDYIIDEHYNVLKWNDCTIRFIQTPGHTVCSNIILIKGVLFTGDTLLKGAKPYVKKRHGGNKEAFKSSIKMIFDTFSDNTIIYPGHGEEFYLSEVRDYYYNYFDLQ